MRPTLILTLLLFFPLVCPAQTQKTSGDPHPDRSAREPVEGPKIFQYHCAACHGSDGRGHGPASLALKQAPPDLTLIAHEFGRHAAPGPLLPANIVAAALNDDPGNGHAELRAGQLMVTKPTDKRERAT